MANDRGRFDKGRVYVAGGAVIPYTDRFDGPQNGSVLGATYTAHSAPNGTDDTARFTGMTGKGVRAYVQFVKGAATSVEIKAQISYDASNWADVASVLLGAGAVEHSLTASGTYAIGVDFHGLWTRFVAKYTGASAVGTSVIIDAMEF